MTNRPKLKLENTPWQNQMEILSIIALVTMIGIAFYYFPILPERIPTHFNGGGQADGWGNKIMIFTLPGIGLAMYILLSLINRAPHLFNFSVEVTKENAAQLYQAGRSLNTTLKAVILCAFLYICWSSVKGALNENLSLGWLFLPLFLGAIAAVIIVHLRMMNQAKNG